MGNPSNERELFGTLLSSTPAPVRAWKSLAIAIGLHVALITIAIVTFKPFQPRPEVEEAHPLNIIVVEEDAVAPLPNPFVRSPPPSTVAIVQPRPREEELTYRPGPLAPIVIDAAPSGPPTVEPPENGVLGNTGSLSTRLLPGRIDPRITSATAFPPPEKTGAEAVRARISDRLSVWNDSMYAEAEAERRATDWTVRDKNGGRWGVAPDGIYLGKVKLPQVAFSPAPGKRDEVNNRKRDFNEIEQQVMREESRSSFKERVQAIRQRKERERAEQQREKQKKTDDKPITESR
jgi:hypothetical protein